MTFLEAIAEAEKTGAIMFRRVPARYDHMRDWFDTEIPKNPLRAPVCWALGTGHPTRVIEEYSWHDCPIPNCDRCGQAGWDHHSDVSYLQVGDYMATDWQTRPARAMVDRGDVGP